MKLKDFDFRIWDKGEKTLTYASKDWKLSIGFSNPQQDNGEFESVLHAYYDGEPQCPDDCEIELWSGFHDKNGTKIYEGDIVKLKDGIYRVWVKNGFFLEDNADNVYTMWFANKYGEVIGNIHENADLLKGVK